MVFKHLVATTRNVSNVYLRLEVDPHHRAQFQVDEQQQDVIDGDVAFVEHSQESHDGSPCGDRPDGKQRHVMEGLDEQIAQRLGTAVQGLTEGLGPIDFHDELP